MGNNDLLERIVLNEDAMVGKPVVKGTRLTVHLILGLMAQGQAIDEILAEYKDLNRDDILACLLFAREALDHIDFVPSTKGS
ncbi:MAG: hypothetical protein BZY80_03345 [SAR202 cluster bacterium Io17-Chloro-G2]|nr:MAG: hypothetical protein BZY80_03345 [SAR202 cluster bacterium Io17-Chloro-G2]